MSNRILLVEDNPELQLTIESSLREFAITTASSLSEATAALARERFDLVILDVSLPDGDGFEFCANQRALSSGEIPLIFMTSKTSISDKLYGFSLGAEDYITKPFDPMELKARVTARIRSRTLLSRNTANFQIGDLRFDLAAQRLALAAEGRETKIDLTPLEFKLLLHFAHNSAQVMSRTQLVHAIWGNDVNVSDRTVDTHVSHLRKKLGQTGCEIQPVYGQGYRFILTEV